MKGLVLVAALLLLPAASAYPESAAPSLDERIVRVWHEPEVPAPGTQWQGFMELAPGHNVSQVKYQICRVGQNCFAPPTPAQDMGDNVWRFDTNDYRDPIVGEPIHWGEDVNGDGSEWLVGVQYFLVDPDHEAGKPVPEGLEIPSEECDAVSWEECSATHYFVFAMPAETSSGEQAPALPVAFLLIALAFLARR